MIPKVIHYCWFGGNPKPEIVQKCIASWRKYCPDWIIQEWNESNFDVDLYQFAKSAYDAKKWAFVSDIARLIILEKCGGFYLDSDVEILKDHPFDDYVNFKAVLPFETERAINSGLCFGAEADATIVKLLLEPYLSTCYTKEPAFVNSQMNKPIFCQKYPTLHWNGHTQIIEDVCFLGMFEYGSLMKHHGMRSWCDDLPKYSVSKDNKVKHILRSPKIFSLFEQNQFFKKIIPLYEFIVYDFLDLGLLYYCKRLLKKCKRKLMP